MTDNWTNSLASRANHYVAKAIALRGLFSRLDVQYGRSCHGGEVRHASCQGVSFGSAGQWFVVEGVLLAGWSWVRVECDDRAVALRVASRSSLEGSKTGVSFERGGRALSDFVRAEVDHEALWVWASKGSAVPRVAICPVPEKLMEKLSHGSDKLVVDVFERSYKMWRARAALCPPEQQSNSRLVGVEVYGRGTSTAQVIATLDSLTVQSRRPCCVTFSDDLKKEVDGETLERVESLVGMNEDVSQISVGSCREFVVPLLVGDLLSPSAIECYEDALAKFEDARVVYADDDLIDKVDGVANPEFKPAFSPLLLTSHDYIVGSCCITKDIWEAVHMNEVHSGIELVTGLFDEQIVHIPKVLHHRLSRDGWRPPSAETEMVEESLVGIRWQLGTRLERVHRFSIVIPIAAKVSLVQRCLSSIEAMSGEENYEVLLDVNGPNRGDLLAFLAGREHQDRVKIVSSARKPGETFNYSRLINGLASKASGDVLVILNDDTEIATPDWLSVIGEYLSFRRIGLVGPKLVYPRSGRIQYGGGVLGVSGVSAHAFVGCASDAGGGAPYHEIVRDVSVITGAAMGLRTEVFRELGGLDDKNLAVSYSDTDLCLKSLEAGYRNVYLPQVVIRHNETATRVRPSSLEERRREIAEFDYAREKWGTLLLESDPYYNPNLTLTYEEGLYNLALEPRDLSPRINRVKRMVD